jgi:SPP1 gp7 family putative phage head morphogenesis protein
VAPPDGSVGATADPSRPEEAIAWFRARTQMTRDEWDALDVWARRRAFMVSGVESLAVINHVWQALDRAIEAGTTFDRFRQDVGQSLAAQWGREDSGRLGTIFRNNVQSAYAAGRWQQMTKPEVAAVRGFWQFAAILDDRTTPICQPLEGVIRPAGDPFWSTRYPPLHHQCRSGVISLTEEQSAAAGGPTEPGDHEPPQEGWGLPPATDHYAPNPADYPPDLWASFEQWSATREP